MNNVLEYKGYFTKIEYSAEDGVLHGKIEGIRDLVNFEGENASEIEKEFHAAVEDYLACCKETNTTPEKPFKGVFNVRLSPEKHRMAALWAAKEGVTLNQFICEAVDEKIEHTYIR